jgi:catechol 2,3-dioxygenase-like lactoylglutathione lyase family enzyme
MEHNAKSLRPFIGSKNFDESRQFYQDLGFTEVVISPAMSLFQNKTVGFYLQNAYVKDWLDNTMLFMEVDDVDQIYNDLKALDLNSKYPETKLLPIRTEPWGRECFLIDPAGVLWHFGAFY